MNWLLIAIIAHFFNAGIFIIDRYLLKKGFPHPVSYAFWSSIIGIFIILLVPFGFRVPGVNQIVFSIAAGLVWVLATASFYAALYKGESSRVVPIVGSIIPILTLFLSFLFLGERLTLQELIAFCFLAGGGLLLSVLVAETKVLHSAKKIHLVKALPSAMAAAFAFAVFFVMTKFVFLHQSFISGLIWIRLGAILGALFMLIPSSFRKIIFAKTEIVKKKTIGLFTLDKTLLIFASFFQYAAVYLGSVTLVNALQGVQYAFLLLLAFILFKKIPSLREQFDKRTLIQKIFAIVLIGIGLVILAI